MPHRTLLGHTNSVTGVMHLPGGQWIITCSVDGSLRLWELESGTQMGEDWRDENDAGVWSMALSPDGKTITSGCDDGKVTLWDVETRKVIANWSEHINVVAALCWSADGSQVLSGSWDGTARVWDVKSDKTVLTINTGHKCVRAVTYSPDGTKIATGGNNENAVKIWDAKAGEPLNTLEHYYAVWSLAWMSDGKKLISGSYRTIMVFDTVTWQQIATLEGHRHFINAISLSHNDGLLASASDDETARLWNLDTNLQAGPPLQHEDFVRCAAISADGQLVTGSENKNVHTWDIQTILKDAGLEKLQPDVVAQESSLNVDATQAEDDELSPGFFNDVRGGAYSSKTCRNYHHSSSRRPRPLAPSLRTASAFFGRLSSPFRRSHSNTNHSTELQRRPRRALLSRGPRTVEVAAVKDREVIFTAPPPPEKTQQQTQSHTRGSSTTQPVPGTDPTSPRARYAYSLPVRMLGHLVLFLCCASPRHADANAQSAQQRQGQGQAHASSSQTQPDARSSSTTPPTPPTSPTAPSAASA